VLSGQPVVRGLDLVKTFKDRRAVDGISLVVGEGERVGLLGPNGAGKTTTLLMLLGAITPDSGSIEITGLRLPRRRSKAMTRVGFVAGYLPLPENLTVRESLELFAGFAGLRKSRADIAGAAEAFGLTELLPRRNQELSSGQRTLVSIVKAVLHRPALLVLDEPTASLDPDIAVRVREAMLDVHRRDGTALLVTSHNMREVEALCERVVLLSRGRIVADGTPAGVAAQFDVDDLEGAFLAVAEAQRGPRVSQNRPETVPTRQGEAG
jgi:ABC-2 type transport system ATP-binding protein